MPVTFSLIGGAGFRAQYYLRIAQALPDRFQIGGLVVRDETKALAMERQWGVRTYRSVEALLQQEQQDFIVLSVSGSEMLPYLLQLAETGIPVLSETPPAPTPQGWSSCMRGLAGEAQGSRSRSNIICIRYSKPGSN